MPVRPASASPVRIARPGIYWLALWSGFALSACVAGADPQSSGGTAPARTFFALGTEPGWTLEITPDRLNYIGEYGAVKIRLPNPGAQPAFNGERYAAGRLIIDIRHEACRDGMSDRRYADKVMVMVDGKSMTGCGGPVISQGIGQGS